MPLSEQIDVLAHVHRILRLEEEFGANVKYQLLDPDSFSLLLNDVEIQRAAKQIRDFVGTDRVIFVVGRAKQKVGVAGHIELDTKSQEVFIELSDDIVSSRSHVLATLAHEITHYYLEVNGIRATSTREYELFTDTAAVFLGMGKLILDGAGSVGYLSARDAGFIYLLVSTMRGIPESLYLAGLGPQAVTMLAELRREYQHHFDARFRSVDSKATLSRIAESTTEEVQRTLAEVESLIAHLLMVVDRSTRALSSEAHSGIATLQGTIDRMTHGLDDHNPCLRYLRAIDAEISIRTQTGTLKSNLSKAGLMHRDAAALTQLIDNRFLSFRMPDGDHINTVSCRRCEKSLRVGKNLELRKVRCPNCLYTFFAKTAPPKTKRKPRLFTLFGF